MIKQICQKFKRLSKYDFKNRIILLDELDYLMTPN